MTFIMDPLCYPSVIKHGRQLDFHQFSNKVAPVVFAYPPVHDDEHPGMMDQIRRAFKLLQGDGLNSLTDSMIGNLMVVMRQDHLGGSGWRSASMYHFCLSVMFEASFLSLFGQPPAGRRHGNTAVLRDDFVRFDKMFPLLIAQVPIRLLGRTKAVRQKIVSHFLPHHMARWSNMSEFVSMRMKVFDSYETLTDTDKAGHHFAILWASVGNTAPATFWALYYLVSHPEALQAVRREIQEVLSLDGVEFRPDVDVRLTKEQLDKLVYLESAVNESLRLSSASMNIRVAQEDFNLRLDESRSIAVRKGDLIAMYPQTMHLDPEVYEEPQTFRFDRFMENGVEKTDFYKDGQKLKYYLMPFGSGSSMCPGRYFAVNEIKQFLCLLLLYLEVQLEDGQSRVNVDPSRAGLGILLPAADVRFRYRLRSA